jgi:hypothetical protein
VDAEGLGEFVEGAQSQVFLGAFDGPDVGSVQAAHCGEHFLRPAALMAKLMNAAPTSRAAVVEG